MSTPVPELPSYYAKYTSIAIPKEMDLNEIFRKMKEIAYSLEGFAQESKADDWVVTVTERTDAERPVKIDMNLFVKQDETYLLEIQRRTGDAFKFNETFKVIKSQMLGRELVPAWQLSVLNF